MLGGFDELSKVRNWFSETPNLHNKNGGMYVCVYQLPHPLIMATAIGVVSVSNEQKKSQQRTDKAVQALPLVQFHELAPLP